MSIILFLTGICIVIFMIIVGSLGALIVNLEQQIHDTEVIYCNDFQLSEVEKVCSEDILEIVPVTAREIIEVRHPDYSETFVIFEDASEKDVFVHLDNLGYGQQQGALEGYVQLPVFVQEELGLTSGEPTEFAWSMYFFDKGIIALFLESNLELERIILYIPS